MRPSNALPYELYADGRFDNKQFMLTMTAKNELFGKQSLGAPFQVYQVSTDDVVLRSYTVIAGDQLRDSWSIDAPYHFQLYGPNGFFRAFKGSAENPSIEITCDYERDAKRGFTGNVLVKLTNTDPQRTHQIQLIDNAYHTKDVQKMLDKAGTKGAQQTILLNLKNSHNWYDFTVKVAGFEAFLQQYAGRVETGKSGFTDPLMGQTIV